jgi:16S rRNA processing protein RimM
MSDWLPFGVIGRAYGIKGWVHIHSHAVCPEDILSYSPWQLRWPNGDVKAIAVAEGRVHGDDGVVARLHDCTDRDAARLLTGAEIWIEKSLLPPLLEEDDFYLADLEGFEVVLTSGKVLGVVKRFFSNGAHDIVIVALEEGAEKMLPFVMEDTVQAIDNAEKRIVMDWPDDA